MQVQKSAKLSDTINHPLVERSRLNARKLPIINKVPIIEREDDTVTTVRI